MNNVKDFTKYDLYNIMSSIRVFLHRYVYSNNDNINDFLFECRKHFQIDSHKDKTIYYISYDNTKYTPLDIESKIIDNISKLILRNKNEILQGLPILKDIDRRILLEQSSIRLCFNIINIDDSNMRLEL